MYRALRPKPQKVGHSPHTPYSDLGCRTCYQTYLIVRIRDGF